MNLNIPMLRPVRILLFPFSLLYALSITIRNWLYDKHMLPSHSFNLPIICIGNLSVGGTGKSPMVEFLIKKLKGHFQIAVLSRGYKRKTKGYSIANAGSTALDIGDEPMQFHSKFPGVTIAVGEERVFAIPQLLHDHPATSAIILDDAFQHRSVRAGLNILLTDFNNLFTRDWFLPTGDLRDEKKSYKRSELIVVSKCSMDLSEPEKQALIREIKPQAHQEIFFSAIQYGKVYHIVEKNMMEIHSKMEVLLVTGIANPNPLKKWLEEICQTYDEISYSDHHIFSIDDLKVILGRFEAIEETEKIILTTEKDAVRLIKFEQALKKLPFYVVPIESVFLFNEEQKFTDIIVKFIGDFDLPTSRGSQ
jgi:tetraacyldisaccharide 4'-kinase